MILVFMNRRYPHRHFVLQEMATVKMSSKTVHHKVIAFSVQYLPSLRNSSTVPSHHPNLSHLFIFYHNYDQKSPIRVCLPSTPFSFLVGTFLTGHRAFVRVVVTPYCQSSFFMHSVSTIPCSLRM